jgi:hypothetical protein
MKDKYEIFTYDLWGNGEDGWEVNDVYRYDKFVIEKNVSDATLIEALRDVLLGIFVDIPWYDIMIEGENEYTLYFSHEGTPLCELRYIGEIDE